MIEMIERASGHAVRICYVITFVGVAALLVLGARDMIGDSMTEADIARDRYAGRPGFDAEESRRNREYAERVTAGRYP